MWKKKDMEAREKGKESQLKVKQGKAAIFKFMLEKQHCEENWIGTDFE